MPNNKYHSPQPGPLGQHIMYGADYNSGVATQPLTLTTEDGVTTYTLFIGTGGKLYLKAGVPANATDGTVVGTQT
jgi:hypothetical protein